MNVKIPILCFYEPIEKIYSFILSKADRSKEVLP